MLSLQTLAFFEIANSNSESSFPELKFFDLTIRLSNNWKKKKRNKGRGKGKIKIPPTNLKVDRFDYKLFNLNLIVQDKALLIN